MKFATLEIGGRATCVVALPDGQVLNLARAAAIAGNAHPALADGSLQSVIDGGSDALGAVAALVAATAQGQCPDAVHPLDGFRFFAPIPAPRKNVFCVGRNYADHIAEGARALATPLKVTEVPIFFTKPATTVIGDGGDIPIFPHVSTMIDYEVELAFVIGKRGRDIAAADAFDHIFGYTILNDISARDVQRRHGGQFFKGKSLDGSGPLGPWVVTPDELGDPGALGIRLWVNGDLRQNDTTASMIFDIPAVIASLSEGLTLDPGDIVATGTPSGVGYAMDPPQFLRDGDTVTCEIDGLGRLTNRMRQV